MPDPTTIYWVGGDLDPPSDTTGWATPIALAYKQTDYELTENVYKWFQENPDIWKYLLNLGYG